MQGFAALALFEGELKLRRAVLLLFLVSGSLLNAAVCSAGTEKPPTVIMGGELEVCQELRKLFDVSENRDYLWTLSELKARGIDAATAERRKNRPLYFPHDEQFHDFSEPKWTDVDDATARLVLPTLVGIQARYQHLVLGKDYEIQKTKFDLDGDGTDDTIYRSFGKGYNQVLMDQTATDALSKAVNKAQIKREPAQLILYKNRPYILVRYGVFDLGAYRLSFGALDKHLAQIGAGRRCAFNAMHRRKLD